MNANDSGSQIRENLTSLVTEGYFHLTSQPVDVTTVRDGMNERVAEGPSISRSSLKIEASPKKKYTFLPDAVTLAWTRRAAVTQRHRHRHVTKS